MENFIKKSLSVFESNKGNKNSYTNPVQNYFEINEKISTSKNRNLEVISFEDKSNLLDLFLFAFLIQRIKTTESRNEITQNITGKGHTQTEKWFFSLRVQAYLQSLSVMPVLDLKDDSEYKDIVGRVCDYSIFDDDADIFHLYEVTSIHKEQKIYTGIEEVILKIQSKMQDKQAQLGNTARFIKVKHDKETENHFCVDISKYFEIFDEPRESSIDKVSKTGFEIKDIEKILSSIKIEEFPDIDNLTVCWKTTFYHKDSGTPVGILYDTLSSSNSEFNMKFWILESYFRKETPNVLSEVRITNQTKSNKRGLDYFATSFNNHYDSGTFWKKAEDVVQ